MYNDIVLDKTVGQDYKSQAQAVINNHHTFVTKQQRSDDTSWTNPVSLKYITNLEQQIFFGRKNVASEDNSKI